MDEFKKTLRIGTAAYGAARASVFCFIKWADQRLSITGVEGPLASGNCMGSCGQIDLAAVDGWTYAEGWDAATVARLQEVWKTYHLNDLTAGSPAQTAYLKDHRVKVEYPASQYDSDCAVLRAAGLNPDPDYLHKGEPYRYGSAWLKTPVPAEALAFLAALPDADRLPPHTWRTW